MSASPDSVDMVVVRENTEGEYADAGGFFKLGSPDAFALQTSIFTRKGCERVFRYAFELARKRKGLGKGVNGGTHRTHEVVDALKKAIEH